jgi:hypothetical protein
MAVIVETNVLATANGCADHVTPHSVRKCIAALQNIRGTELVLVDDAMRIFKEYLRYATPKGQPGLGDVFLKWIWDNRANQQVCRQIKITQRTNAPDDFNEFPVDNELSRFDWSDRKWVAVSIASGLGPRILNATDTDWWQFSTALRRHNIVVEFLCPELMPAAE